MKWENRARKESLSLSPHFLFPGPLAARLLPRPVLPFHDRVSKFAQNKPHFSDFWRRKGLFCNLFFDCWCPFVKLLMSLSVVCLYMSVFCLSVCLSVVCLYMSVFCLYIYVCLLFVYIFMTVCCLSIYVCLLFVYICLSVVCLYVCMLFVYI